jgi:hypothetical protein
MLNRTLIGFFLFVFCFNLSAQTGENPNLLNNGNFAEGTDNWKIYLTDPNKPIKAQVIEQSDSYASYGLADNYVGTNFVELDASSAIQQDVETDEGEPYVLVFAYAHRPEAGDKQLIVQINGKAVWTKTIKNSSENGKFTYKVIKFKGEDKANIAFYAVSLNGDEEKGVLISDVLVNKEPEVNLELFDAFQR